tara:strand:+ start:4503 stop:5309 length:807 start_codon:yes stop_codon:yes gene_type:complete
MKKIALYFFLIGSSLWCIYPFIWMFFSSFKTNREIYQPTTLMPASYEWKAYENLFAGESLSFLQFFTNSLLLSSGQAILATILSVGTAFVLAKFRLKGGTLILGLAILLILIPKQTLAVPMFEWMNWLGWQGSLWSLLLPGAITGLGVVFFLQLFRNFPNEWIELARIEGLSPMKTLLLLLPLVSPGLVTFFILHFVLSWQEHLLPLLLLDDESITLPLAITKLQDSSYRIPLSVTMAAATLSILPMLLAFGIFFGKMKTALREVAHS